PGGTGTIGRFYEVDVTLWAELGRATLPLGQLVRLAEGSVIELGRPITEPVDLMAQGVRVARGEVVVVDDCFALRIKEIDSLPESR
ncbi:MAG: FliM/FliN family flagellar motor switch protein, partial [Planctomycetaceae bacterium]